MRIEREGMMSCGDGQFMQKFSQKFKTAIAAVAAVPFGVYGFRKLQALTADPRAKGFAGDMISARLTATEIAGSLP